VGTLKHCAKMMPAEKVSVSATVVRTMKCVIR
jgi:hypothetical protein